MISNLNEQNENPLIKIIKSINLIIMNNQKLKFNKKLHLKMHLLV